jgi:hypothetical protein
MKALFCTCYTDRSAVLMVAPDVDSELFDADAPDNDNGAALLNLIYRPIAPYSRRDAVLGGSVGLKFCIHRLNRRLGQYPFGNPTISEG